MLALPRHLQHVRLRRTQELTLIVAQAPRMSPARKRPGMNTSTPRSRRMSEAEAEAREAKEEERSSSTSRARRAQGHGGV